MSKPPKALDWLILFALALAWGFSFWMIKKSLVVYTPLQAASLRMGIATLVYAPVAWLYFKKIDWRKWKPLLVVSLCGSGIPNYFFAVAQTRVSSSLAGVLNSLTPLFTMLIGMLIFGQPGSRNRSFGVVLGLAGAVLLVLFGHGWHFEVGVEAGFAVFCVLATICYAINANTVHRYLAGEHPIAIGAAAFCLTGPFYLLSLFFTGAVERTFVEPFPWTAVGSLTYLAVIGTAAASAFYFLLIQRTSAVFAASTTYLLPLVAIVVGLLDGEVVTPVHFVGLGLILGGLYLVRKG